MNKTKQQPTILLDNLPTRKKVEFLDLLKSGQDIKRTYGQEDPWLQQMIDLGLMERLDIELGVSTMRPTQKMRDICAKWDEQELRQQIILEDLMCDNTAEITTKRNDDE